MLECMMSMNTPPPDPTWATNFNEMPSTLAYGSAGQSGDDIYFMARNESGSPYQYFLYRLTNGVAIQLTTVPGAIFGARMFVANRKCWVIGFGAGTSENRSLRYYDLDLRNWSTSVTYPKPLAWSSVYASGNKGYFCASTARNDTGITQFDVSSPGSVKIKELPTPNVNRSHMVLVAQDDYLYYGGGMSDTVGFEAHKDFYRMKISTGEITRLADLPEVGYYACSYGVFGNTIVVANPMSGTAASSTATFSNKIFYYNIEKDTWSYGPDAPTNDNQGQFTFLKNNFYRIGGRNNTRWSSKFDRLGSFT